MAKILVSHRFMQRVAIITAAIYLQSCQTFNVVDLAKGIEKGKISNSATIYSTWLDSVHNEFIVCMEDIGSSPNKKENRYMLTIPKDTVSSHSSDHIQFSQRIVTELNPEKRHWWNANYRTRTDVKVYDLTITVNYHCTKPKDSWQKIQIIQSPNDLASKEAMLFKGQTITQMISRKLPFMVFVNETPTFVEPENLCKNPINQKCLLLVSNPNLKDSEHPEKQYAEILTPDVLIWTSTPKPLWYLALPFAIAADLIALTIFLFIFGAAVPVGA